MTLDSLKNAVKVRLLSSDFSVNLLLAFIVFIVAVTTRILLYPGLVLGDDPFEFFITERTIVDSPDFKHQIYMRFGVWIPSFLTGHIFGVTEFGFAIAGIILSSLLAVFVYFILISGQNKIDRKNAFLGTLVFCLTPFEVLMGTHRANDMYLNLVTAASILTYLRLGFSSKLAAILVAILLWYGFYIKLWMLYLAPPLMLFYAHQFWFKKEREPFLAFLGVSAVLHILTFSFWYFETGHFFPIMKSMPGNSIVPTQFLADLFLQYPRQLFFGSEHGNTLFGWVPYALLVDVCFRGFWLKQKFDFVDRMLLFLILSFFVCINFVSTSFDFSAFYSAPRIFRYLAPLSFLMSLYLARTLVMWTNGHWVFVLAMFLNIWGTYQAHRPSLNFSNSFSPIVQKFVKDCPETIISDPGLQSRFQIYLRPHCPRIEYRSRELKGDTTDFMNEMAAELDSEIFAVTGAPYYIYYFGEFNSMLLRDDLHKISPSWTMVAKYPRFAELTDPEPIRLWRRPESPFDTTPLIHPKDQNAKDLFIRKLYIDIKNTKAPHLKMKLKKDLSIALYHRGRAAQCLRLDKMDPQDVKDFSEDRAIFLVHMVLCANVTQDEYKRSYYLGLLNQIRPDAEKRYYMPKMPKPMFSSSDRALDRLFLDLRVWVGRILNP